MNMKRILFLLMTLCIGQECVAQSACAAQRGVLGAFYLGSNQTVDGHAFCVELCFVVGHDANRTVCVQVVGHFAQLPAFVFKLFQRPGEQRGVVGLEVNLTTHRQNVCVLTQEVGCGQTVLCVAALGPGIAEVDVNTVCFAVFEDLGELDHVTVHEANVFQTHFANAFHSNDHGIGNLFNGYQKYVGVCFCGVCGETALAAAQLQIKLFMAGISFRPLAAKFLRVFIHKSCTLVHSGCKIGSFSHSHIKSHSKLKHTTSMGKHQSPKSLRNPKQFVNRPHFPLCKTHESRLLIFRLLYNLSKKLKIRYFPVTLPCQKRFNQL